MAVGKGALHRRNAWAGAVPGWMQGTRGRGPATDHGPHRPTCLSADVQDIVSASVGVCEEHVAMARRGMGEERVGRERKEDLCAHGNRLDELPVLHDLDLGEDRRLYDGEVDLYKKSERGRWLPNSSRMTT